MKLTPSDATRPLALAALTAAAVAALLAGCGGSSPQGGAVAHLGSSTGRGSTSGAGSTSADSPSPGSPQAMAIAFAKCMRANGEPNFPEPSAGGGFRFHRGAGVDPLSAAFKAAQAKCKSFQPEGGPGSGPPPSTQTLAHYLKVAQCMRRHGVSGFPDPRTSVPSNLHPPSGARRFVVSDIEGVILVMGSIDESSPTFTRAAAACAFPLHNH